MSLVGMQAAAQAEFRLMHLAFTGWTLRWRVKHGRRRELWQLQVALAAYTGRMRVKVLHAWQQEASASAAQRRTLMQLRLALSAWHARACCSSVRSGWYGARLKLRHCGYKNEVRTLRSDCLCTRRVLHMLQSLASARGVRYLPSGCNVRHSP